MNIVACIKQVPGTTEVKIDNSTNTIVREGVAAIINPFDLYAVEEAVRIKEKTEGKVTALSMGILSVAELLKDTIAVGADEAVLLSDRAFAGSDTLATSYTLAMGIRKIGEFDLIICGKQSADGDTAQVGPSLAEKLGIPHLTMVKKIIEISKKHLLCERLTDDGFEVVELQLPAVITVVKDINTPRLPSIKGKMRAKNAEIKIWNAEDICADKELCGLNGSPTQVISTFIPNFEASTEIIETNANEAARILSGILTDMGLN